MENILLRSKNLSDMKMLLNKDVEKLLNFPKVKNPDGCERKFGYAANMECHPKTSGEMLRQAISIAVHSTLLHLGI